MRRIFAYTISLLLFLSGAGLYAQDTVFFPLKIRAGFDLIGPAVYIYNKDNLNLEGYLSLDRNEKMSYVIEGGYLKYKYSQYNYDYISTGVFTRIGVDFNLLKPEISLGKYWAGVGLRYGLSFYSSETPSFSHDNYWGTATSSIPQIKSTGHFFELTPGFKTELLRNFTVGWTIRLKLLISGGGTRDIKTIYIPGYGNGGKTVTLGINYYISWNIPLKTRMVITKPVVPEEPEENEEEGLNQQTTDVRQ